MEHPLAPVSVFIVEDELIAAEDIRQTLEKLGYTVTGIARSGESALAFLAASRPDIVLMDIHLAGSLDGIDTSARIHALYTIPVIFLTAHADENTLARAKVTGPYGYVLKPFDERELHTAIEMGLYKHRMEALAKENERTIRVLANAIPDAVMLLDYDRQIIALNDAMARRLGYNYPDEHPVTPEQSDYNGMVTSLKTPVEEILRTGRPVRFEEKTGDEWFEISLLPVSGPGDKKTHFLVQYHDITDHKAFEDQLKKEGITQIEKNMEKFQILNDQIRNPLQAIMGYVSLDCIQYRERIIEQVRLIDTLVDRLDRGWVESEKVRRFLLRHFHQSPDDLPDPGPEETGGRRG
jgi:two-component system, response regulator PdtaR